MVDEGSALEDQIEGYGHGRRSAPRIAGCLEACPAGAYVAGTELTRGLEMQAALLPDRGVVKVVGDAARSFLNGLVTADMAKVVPERSCFAALLTPQGKIIVDFIIAEASAEDGGGFFLDCPRALASNLVDRLNFYKLRAKLSIEDFSESL